MAAPVAPGRADYLVVESTYGNRRHENTDPQQEFGEVIRRTAARGGVVIVPSFAVGRAQGLLWAVHRLKTEGQIPIGRWGKPEEFAPHAPPVGIAEMDRIEAVPLWLQSHETQAAFGRELFELFEIPLAAGRAWDTNALDEAVATGRLRRGQLAVISGFGAGLAWGTAVIRY